MTETTQLDHLHLYDTDLQALARRNYQGGMPIELLSDAYLFEEHGCYFHTVDGRFAKIWRIQGADGAMLNNEELHAVCTSFGEALNKFPYGSSGQFIRHTHRDIRGLMSHYASNLDSDLGEFESALADSIIKRQYNAAIAPNGFFAKLSPATLEKMRADALSALENEEDDDVRANVSNAIQREINEGRYPFISNYYLIFMWEPEYMFGKFIDQMRDMLILFKELFDFRVNHTGFKLAPFNYSVIKVMQEIYDRYPKAQKDDPQQTKIIPSRLYAAIINSFSSELDDFIAYADAIVEFYRERKDSSLFGLPVIRARKNKASISWDDAVAQYDLGSLFRKKSIACWTDLNGYLGEVQCVAKYWIHLFSGMRSNEARHLPASTYKTIKAAGTEITILRGYTSKIEAQNHTETFWVTSGIAEKCTIAARKIGRISAILFQYDDTNLDVYPLFPALKKVRSKIQAFEGGPVVAEASQGRALKRVISRWPDLVVKEVDILELEQFDGFRDWRNDADVKVGKVWPLTTHQCRRSLAVYCARSGLVSVGSSALQFKQLTEAMASYYRRGSVFAVNFLVTDDAQNFIAELEYERHKVQYLNYEKSVINTTSRLWGGEGARIQTARDKGRALIITTDRKVTEKRFQKGEMAFNPSLVGFCTNIEPCDKISFTNILNVCIGCEKSIMDDRSLMKIKRGVSNLKRGQAIFEADSPQYKQLEKEIKSIYETLDKRGLREKMDTTI